MEEDKEGGEKDDYIIKSEPRSSLNSFNDN